MCTRNELEASKLDAHSLKAQPKDNTFKRLLYQLAWAFVLAVAEISTAALTAEAKKIVAKLATCKKKQKNFKIQTSTEHESSPSPNNGKQKKNNETQ